MRKFKICIEAEFRTCPDDMAAQLERNVHRCLASYIIVTDKHNSRVETTQIKVTEVKRR